MDQLILIYIKDILLLNLHYLLHIQLFPVYFFVFFLKLIL